MPTRKQRRRAAKEKRHEYETVWVDSEGNELEEPPEEEAPARDERREGKTKAQPAAKGGRAQPRTGVRTPPPPSWERAGKRALMLGAVVFALFYLTGGKSGSHLLSSLALSAVYTALFVPFTYAVDRYAYQRFLRRHPTGGRPPARKR